MPRFFELTERSGPLRLKALRAAAASCLCAFAPSLLKSWHGGRRSGETAGARTAGARYVPGTCLAPGKPRRRTSGRVPPLSPSGPPAANGLTRRNAKDAKGPWKRGQVKGGHVTRKGDTYSSPKCTCPHWLKCFGPPWTAWKLVSDTDFDAGFPARFLPSREAAPLCAGASARLADTASSVVRPVGRRVRRVLRKTRLAAGRSIMPASRGFGRLGK